MRSVSVLEVGDPSVWGDLAAQVALEPHLAEPLGPTRRVVRPSFDKVILPKLLELGASVLVRWARRDEAQIEAATHDLTTRVASLPSPARLVLHAAQRHAVDDVVVATPAWDPLGDADAVRALLGAGLLQAIPEDDGAPSESRVRLHPDLPAPPPIDYAFADAIMSETDDLDAPAPGPVALLHDLASLAAAIEHVRPGRTHAGAVTKADGKRLVARLGTPSDAPLEDHPRWGRALRTLEALRVVSMDPITRELHLDLGLEATLAGDTPEAVDHLLLRLVEPDLHGVVPAVRAALRQAGDQALDEVVFLELLRERHRDLIFPAWRRDGAAFYPLILGELPRPYDHDGFEAIEARMVRALLGRMARLGLVRRAPGVFTATPDGRVWAGAGVSPAPPLWVSSDLEIVVPPGAVTPWERFQIERLGRCLSRDVVDRYRLERRGLETWLATHELDEALALLQRRCPAVPRAVHDTLTSWARAATRIVLVRGILLEG
jgi:hypothetical protein